MVKYPQRNSFPLSHLEYMQREVKSMKQEVSAWDHPENDFSEEQQLAFGNLCFALEQAEDYFNSAIRASKEGE